VSLTGVTLGGRRAAERLMTDACTITRAAGAPVFDEATGTYTTPTPTTLYSGKCRVKTYRQNNDRVVDFGGEPVSLWPFSVSVPVEVTGLEVDDIVTVTASVLDPDVVGTRLRVRDVVKGSQITARRLGCEVNAG
jgi:hypothetical protein